MNSLINSFAVCPSTNAPSAASTAAVIFASSASNAFKQLFNPVDLLCVLFFLSTVITLVLYAFEFKQLMASANKSIVSSLNEFESYDQLDSEILMSKINRARQNKRPSMDNTAEEPEACSKVKSPKLMCIELNSFESQQKIKSRRNSLPKSPFKTIELDVPVQEFKVPLSPNHERITLIEKDDDEANEVIEVKINNESEQRDHQHNQHQVKPFEWYLRWDLPDDELAELSFAEKSRRFYHLTHFGDVKQQFEYHEIPKQNKKPLKKPFEWYLRWDVPAEELECLSYSEKATRFSYLTDYGEIRRQHHPAAKPPEEQELIEVFKQPMNSICDLVACANNINIPEYMMQLLKQNHQLTSSLLKLCPLRKEDYCIISMLRGRINYPMLFTAEKYYMKPAIQYSLPVPVVKKPENNKVQWGKPLTKEQLRNILFIIGQ